MELKDKRVFITGASRGIGYAVARELLNQGARVFLTGLPPEEEVAAACRKLDPSGTGAHYAVMDSLDEDSVRDAVRKALDTLGGIDILINNAGITFQDMAWEEDFSKAKKEIGVNYLGTFLVTQLVLPGMLENRQGMIINTASMLGKVPGPTQANYSASKAAIIALSAALRSEAEDQGIVVKVFMPGLTDTGMTKSLKIGAPRLLRPEQVAQAMVKFIQSEKPEHVCGLINRMTVNLGRFFPETMRKATKNYVLKSYYS